MASGEQVVAELRAHNAQMEVKAQYLMSQLQAVLTKLGEHEKELQEVKAQRNEGGGRKKMLCDPKLIKPKVYSGLRSDQPFRAWAEDVKTNLAMWNHTAHEAVMSTENQKEPLTGGAIRQCGLTTEQEVDFHNFLKSYTAGEPRQKIALSIGLKENPL